MKAKGIYLSLFTIFTLTHLFSCELLNSSDSSNVVSVDDSNNESMSDNLYGMFTDIDYLKVDGKRIINQDDEQVFLRGINAGGYLVLERWMCAISNSGNISKLDHKTITEIFVERFGTEKTLELWKYYRDNFWTEQDFVNCNQMGMNVIRLPFTYMSVDPTYYNVPAQQSGGGITLRF